MLPEIRSEIALNETSKGGGGFVDNDEERSHHHQGSERASGNKVLTLPEFDL